MSVDDFRQRIEEPEAKRSRLDVEEEAEEPLWDGNYVCVEEKLPPNSMLFVSFELN